MGSGRGINLPEAWRDHPQEEIREALADLREYCDIIEESLPREGKAPAPQWLFEVQGGSSWTPPGFLAGLEQMFGTATLDGGVRVVQAPPPVAREAREEAGPICPIEVDQQTRTVKERGAAEFDKAHQLSRRACETLAFLVAVFPRRFVSPEQLGKAMARAGVDVGLPGKALSEALASPIVDRWLERQEGGRPRNRNRIEPPIGLRDFRSGPKPRTQTEEAP